MRAYFLYNISMRKWGYHLFSVLLSALVVLTSADVAFALPKKLPKLKGGKLAAPKTILPKTPTVPVVKPNVPAQAERIVTAQVAAQAAKAVTPAQVAFNTVPNTVHNPVPAASITAAQNAAFPMQFSALADWIQKLPATQLTVPTPATIQAIKNLREKIYTYHSLSHAQQEELTQLAATLDKVRSRLQRSRTQNSRRLIYRGSIAPEEMPKIENFHLYIQQIDGITYPFTKTEREDRLHLAAISLASNWNDRSKMRCFHFNSGYSPETLKQEFARALQAIVPPGYTVRMGISELGLKNDLEKFRQGNLHLHLEKNNIVIEELPVDISIKVWLNVKYFAGEVDPQTRKVIRPFDDKTIANTYLILFGDYLDQPALHALSKLIYTE